jgi:hypothetical protein
VKSRLGLFLSQQAMIEDGRSKPRQVRPMIPPSAAVGGFMHRIGRRDGSIALEDRRFTAFLAPICREPPSRRRFSARFAPRSDRFGCEIIHDLLRTECLLDRFAPRPDHPAGAFFLRHVFGSVKKMRSSLSFRLTPLAIIAILVLVHTSHEEALAPIWLVSQDEEDRCVFRSQEAAM